MPAVPPEPQWHGDQWHGDQRYGDQQYGTGQHGGQQYAGQQYGGRQYSDQQYRDQGFGGQRFRGQSSSVPPGSGYADAGRGWPRADEGPGQPYGGDEHYTGSPGYEDGTPYGDERYADERYADERYADERYADERYADERYADDEVYSDDDRDQRHRWEDRDDEPLIRTSSRSRSGRGRTGRSGRRGRRMSAPLVAVLVIAVFLAGGGIAGYKFLRQYVIPPDYSGAGFGSVVVEVKSNQTATDVGRTLLNMGVVASQRAFVKAAEQSSNPRGLEPGFYRLHKHMKALLAWDLLLSPASRIQVRISIPEGLRVDQIIQRLSAKSGISIKDYRAALANPAALGLPSYAKNRPEGYLFPATYPVEPKMSATDVLRTLVQQFNAEATRINLVATAHSVNLKPAEAIIVASLVQAEGGRVADFPKIARVIYNRLDAGMKLQLDSTVMYALHTFGILATNKQLQVNSPYNTYLHANLPPGPIDSPGDAAIQAALHPAHGNWLYFVTVDPKTRVTKFTSSAAEFAALRAELQQNLANGR